MSEDPVIDRLEKRLNALLPSLRYASRPPFHTRMGSHHGGSFLVAEFKDHGLVVEWCEHFVSQIKLVVPGEEYPLQVYSYTRYATPGAHWDYIHDVFSPWLVALALAERQADERAATAAREKAVRDRDNALAAWANARQLQAPTAPSPAIDDAWEDLRKR